MKKILLAVFSVLAFSAVVSAQEEPVLSEKPFYKNWALFQLGIFPGVPSYVNNSRVIGVKTGWPISGGSNSVVDGFESSWIYSGTDYVNGLQASLFMNISKQVIGFEPAIALNINRESVHGFQASCVFNLARHVKGVQAGGLNIADSVCGFQPGVLGCITQKMTGCQMGLFTIAKHLDGAQFAPLFNIAREVGDSFQMGLVNISEKRGVQIGLVNVISGGPLPFFPFVNFSL